MLRVATRILLRDLRHIGGHRGSFGARIPEKGRRHRRASTSSTVRAYSYLAANRTMASFTPPQIAPAPGRLARKIGFVAVGMPALGIPTRAMPNGFLGRPRAA